MKSREKGSFVFERLWKRVVVGGGGMSCEVMYQSHHPYFPYHRTPAAQEPTKVCDFYSHTHSHTHTSWFLSKFHLMLFCNCISSAKKVSYY